MKRKKKGPDDASKGLLVGGGMLIGTAGFMASRGRVGVAVPMATAGVGMVTTAYEKSHIEKMLKHKKKKRR